MKESVNGFVRRSESKMTRYGVLNNGKKMKDFVKTLNKLFVYNVDILCGNYGAKA